MINNLNLNGILQESQRARVRAPENVIETCYFVANRKGSNLKTNLKPRKNTKKLFLTQGIRNIMYDL